MIKRILKIFLILLIVIISLAGLFVITLQIFEYRPADETILTIENNVEDVATSYVQLNQNIKAMTFNIGYSSLSQTEDFVMDGGEKGRMDDEESVQANLDGISQILLDADANIFFLQEVDVDSDRSYNIQQYATLSDLLNMPVTLGYNYRCIFVPFPLELGQMMGNVNSGIMTSTEYYAEEATRIQLPGSFSWPLRLANLKRCAVVTRMPIFNSNKYLVIINVHLSAYDDGTMRLQEMAALQTLMQTEYALGNYVVVGGDFNQTFPGAYTENEDATTDYLYELKDPSFWQAYGMDDTWFTEQGWLFGVDPSTPTCRLLHQPYDTVNLENNQYYVIDGFIVSPNVDIISVTTLVANFQYSDHNPVELIFNLRP